ncbi:MAG TPA: 5'/3'-nucleotidase SurE [Spirochaetia bacterium]|jgi:5'-nucleotidase|nr:5'/3'-nucleotidase SurE [Spirochaetia bacterium]
MNILLTNDDGIDSPGLHILARTLEGEHRVMIVAPDGERSGKSHSISLGGPVKMRRITENTLSCDGTPADCVLFSILGAIPFKPDIVISGINRGPNLGTDIIYSGTAAAARQAALMGYAAIAVSVTPYSPPYPYETAASFIRDNIDLFLSLWTCDHFLNINVPAVDPAVMGVEVTHPSRRIYNDRLVRFQAPNKDEYFFLTGSRAEARLEEGSDWHAVVHGNISVSPIFLHPLNHVEDEAYRRTVFRKPLRYEEEP